MIINVSNKGIEIDVSSSPELTKKFRTTHAVIPVGFISNFKIKLAEGDNSEVVYLEDLVEEAYSIHFSLVTSVNGVAGFTSNLEVFNAIKTALFNL